MLTPDQIAQAKATTAPTSATGGALPGQAMTPEQAQAWIGGAPAQAPDNRNIIQQGIGAFLDPIINAGVHTGQALGGAALTGIDLARGGNLADPLNAKITNAENAPAQVPITGTHTQPTNQITPENTVGNAVSTVALGMPGAAAGGAMLGAGAAMQGDKGVGETAIDTVVGALSGKILEHGFNAIAPYVEKAAVKYGPSVLDKLSQFVPDSAKATVKAIADKIPNVSSALADKKILPSGVSSAIDKTSTTINNAVEKPFSAASSAVTKVHDNLASAITSGNPDNVDTYLSQQYQKGVRPTVVGNNTGKQLEANQGRQLDAVKAIVKNKPNLKILDQYGEPTGTVPKTLNEFTQAIDQTKENIFAKYDALQTKAGGKGSRVDLKPAATELKTVAQNKVLRDLHPDIAKYAAGKAKVLRARGSYTPDETQTAIKNLNKSLDAFYKNPSYDTASRASIDALMVNKMRDALDTTISKSTGKGYQELKNQYGALRSIEKDVVHRAIVDGRKNTIGLLGSIGDYASGLEVVRGLLTMNPVDLATGGAVKGISAYQKWMNNPNTAIKRLFEAADRAESGGTTGLTTGQDRTPQPQKGLPNKSSPQPTTPSKSVKPPKGKAGGPNTQSGHIKNPFADAPKDENAPKTFADTLKEIQQKFVGTISKEQEHQFARELAGIPESVAKGDEESYLLGHKLSQAKGLSADDIMAKHPDINLKRDVPITDIHGEKHVIPEGEALTPYELKGNKVLLQDGETYIVSKNQYQNIKGNAVSGEAKPFAPELKGTEETVYGMPSKADIDLLLSDEVGQGMTRAEAREYLMNDEELPGGRKPAKFEQYTLPGGKNYKEIVIKAPTFAQEMMDKYHTNEIAKWSKEDQALNKKDTGGFKSSHFPDDTNPLAHIRLNERTYKGKPVTFMEELQSDWNREGRDKGFADPNHKDLTELPQGYKVREGRSESRGTKEYRVIKPDGSIFGYSYAKKSNAIADAIAKLNVENKGTVPNHPLLKNWQTLAVKRGLQEAVNNGSEYFSWINGEQTSARYNLATYVENVKWKREPNAVTGRDKRITIIAKGGSEHTINIDKKGAVTETSGGSFADWKGKKLDEVLGKGLADSIMSKESGTLSGEGLKFGGEWANTLYDKQTWNNVKDILGLKDSDLLKMDMGLPVSESKEWHMGSDNSESARKRITESNLGKVYGAKVGDTIHQKGTGVGEMVITEILGDGKFKAVSKHQVDEAGGFKLWLKKVNGDIRVPHGEFRPTRAVEETYDVSKPKSVQQGIRLTPEIKAKIRGEAPTLKKPSGKTPFGK